jgi:hypothetical protein
MSGGFAGPNPIGWPDIDAFVRISGLRLAPWETGILEALDDIYLAAGMAKKAPQPKDKGVIAMASASDAAGVRSLMGAIGVRKTVKRKG